MMWQMERGHPGGFPQEKTVLKKANGNGTDRIMPTAAPSIRYCSPDTPSFTRRMENPEFLERLARYVG